MALRLFRQAYLSYRGLFLWLNWPAYVSNVFIRPGLLVAMFALTGRFARGEAAAEAYVIGMTAYAIPGILMGSILQSFYYERAFGTLGIVFASSGSRLQSLVCRGVFHYPNAVLTVVVSLAFAYAVLGSDFSRANWAAVSLSYLVMAASVTAFALLLGSFCIVLRDWQILTFIAQSGTIIFAGTIIPRSSLPPGIHEIGGLLPITHGLTGLRQAFEGASLGSIQEHLAAEALLGVVYVGLAYAAFLVLQVYGRRSGTYELV